MKEDLYEDERFRVFIQVKGVSGNRSKRGSESKTPQLAIVDKSIGSLISYDSAEDWLKDKIHDVVRDKGLFL